MGSVASTFVVRWDRFLRGFAGVPSFICKYKQIIQLNVMNLLKSCAAVGKVKNPEDEACGLELQARAVTKSAKRVSDNSM